MSILSLIEDAAVELWKEGVTPGAVAMNVILMHKLREELTPWRQPLRPVAPRVHSLHTAFGELKIHVSPYVPAGTIYVATEADIADMIEQSKALYRE